MLNTIWYWIHTVSPVTIKTKEMEINCSNCNPEILFSKSLVCDFDVSSYSSEMDLL